MSAASHLGSALLHLLYSFLQGLVLGVHGAQSGFGFLQSLLQEFSLLLLFLLPRGQALEPLLHGQIALFQGLCLKVYREKFTTCTCENWQSWREMSRGRVSPFSSLFSLMRTFICWMVSSKLARLPVPDPGPPRGWLMSPFIMDEPEAMFQSLRSSEISRWKSYKGWKRVGGYRFRIKSENRLTDVQPKVENTNIFISILVYL